jgi:hypothetical protein
MRVASQRDDVSVVDVIARQLFVTPAGTPFRGYRWPRDGEPCLFLAVAPAGASFKRL